MSKTYRDKSGNRCASKRTKETPEMIIDRLIMREAEEDIREALRAEAQNESK